MIMIFKVNNFSSEQSLQLLAPSTKKPLHPIAEVQSNRHQRYQKYYLKLTVLSRMNKKVEASKFSSQLHRVSGTVFKSTTNFSAW